MRMFAPSHLPADRHEDSGGEMRCDTRAHTRQVVAVVALMILRAYGSPGETQRRVPDVDCKYPTVVYTTWVRVWLSLRTLFVLSRLLYYSESSPRTFLICCIAKQQLRRLLSFCLVVIWTVCVEQWEEIVSDYLEAADNKYLSSVCTSPGQCKRCWATGLTITPHLAWWWDTNKRSLDRLKIPRHKIISSTTFEQFGKTNFSEMKAACVHAQPQIKDHLCLLVCKIMWGW